MEPGTGATRVGKTHHFYPQEVFERVKELMRIVQAIKRGRGVFVFYNRPGSFADPFEDS